MIQGRLTFAAWNGWDADAMLALDGPAQMFYICSLMSTTDPRLAMLSELSACAYRLGLVFGGEAERAGDTARRGEYFQLFDRCFFSVRVAIALELRLAHAPAERRAADLRQGPGDREDLADRGDPSEAERPERETDLRERDRDRETESASLPVLLRTLHEIAADAAASPGPEPAALPTLRELLAHVAPDPSTQAPKAGLRARLAGSGAVSALKLAPSRPSPLAGAFALRRATGPPRR